MFQTVIHTYILYRLIEIELVCYMYTFYHFLSTIYDNEFTSLCINKIKNETLKKCLAYLHIIYKT